MKMSKYALTGGTVLFAACALVSSLAAQPVSPRSIPDFSGAWMSSHARKFIPPASGPAPVMDDPAHPHRARGVDANGRDTGTTPWVGDYRNPNLKPWVAAAVKKAGDDDMAGKAHPTAEASCWPAGVPLIMNFFEPAFFLQRPDEVIILYQRGPNIRHVYLNRPHTANPKPSWYGESVGHYDGDTLVIDTIGFNDKTMLDSYMTPHSDALHVVERYRIVDLPAAARRNEAVGDAFVLTGKTMRVDFTVEDPKAFDAPWSATATYRNVNQTQLEESICAENNTDQFTAKMFPIPVAQRADF
jgi:hypothetical protein